MKISQPERGGNGVRTAVVNQRFRSDLVAYPVNPRAFLREIAHKSDGFILPVPLSDNLLQQIITRRGLSLHPLNLFDCATARSFDGCQGRKGFVR
jgi:hypothetical protein